MSEKLLIADDDEFIRSATQEVLEQAGYSVEIAVDGLDAWEKIQEAPSRFDLMLLDKKMPGMSGIALLKNIKSDNLLKDIPVIMLTGDNSQQDVAEGLAEGAYYYLVKPSTEEVLKRVIRNALDDFRQKRELCLLAGHQANGMRILCRAEFRLQTLQEAKDLALWLANAGPDSGRTVNGYAELLINAVEHGNLGITYDEKNRLLSEGRWLDEVGIRQKNPLYSGRLVKVVLEKTASALRVTISDEGNGFDWRNYLDFSPERLFDLNGRGIAMSKAMSFDDLEYLGNGNTVVATVKIPA